MSDDKKMIEAANLSKNEKDSGSLADSSVNAPDAGPAGAASGGEGHRKIPGNDQADGLKAAEKTGKNPAKP